MLVHSIVEKGMLALRIIIAKFAADTEIGINAGTESKVGLQNYLIKLGV